MKPWFDQHKHDEPRDTEPQMTAALRAAVAKNTRPPSHSLRLALLVGLGMIGVAAIASFAPRPDLATYPRLRGAFELATLFVLAISALVIAVRPPFKPAADTRSTALVIIAASLPALPILLPGVPGHPAFTPSISCFTFGIALSLPAAALAARLVQLRGPSPLILAGIGAGAFGLIALHLHCPDTTGLHLALGHATVPMAAALIAVAAATVLAPNR